MAFPFSEITLLGGLHCQAVGGAMKEKFPGLAKVSPRLSHREASLCFESAKVDVYRIGLTPNVHRLIQEGDGVFPCMAIYVCGVITSRWKNCSRRRSSNIYEEVHASSYACTVCLYQRLMYIRLIMSYS